MCESAQRQPQLHLKHAWSNPEDDDRDRGVCPDRGDVPDRVDPVTHYLRTFEHLAPTDTAAPPRRPRRRIWIALPLLAVLALVMLRRPHQEPPPASETMKRGGAPRIALAPSEQQAPAVDAPPVRVVEQQGPKLIEKLLAEKFGTLPKAPVAPARQPEPPAIAAPKQAPPPIPQVAETSQIPDKSQRAEKPPVEKPVMVATAPPRLTPPLFPSRPAEPASARPEPTAPKPVPPASKPTAKPEPPTAKPQVVAKSEPPAVKPQAVAKPEVAKKPEPKAPTTARVEEQPVVVARAEPARPVEALEQRPIAVIERPVPAPVPVQPAVRPSAPQAESAPVEAERVAAAVRTQTSRPSGPSHDAVRGLLDRYAAAWRGHDVDTLRAIGQVTNDGQANALRQYFANVRDLQVEVRVLDIRSEGDRATVRFTRRDTFRDPTGREVAKESPPIEKDVVTTPQGLRFAPAS